MNNPGVNTFKFDQNANTLAIQIDDGMGYYNEDVIWGLAEVREAIEALQRVEQQMLAREARFSVTFEHKESKKIEQITLTVDPGQHCTESLIDLAVKRLYGPNWFWTQWYGDEEADGCINNSQTHQTTQVKVYLKREG